jgi:predicted P-loop ATPase/GTPase
VYIPVSHVYKLACTLHRTINLLPLVCCTLTSDISRVTLAPSYISLRDNRSSTVAIRLSYNLQLLDLNIYLSYCVASHNQPQSLQLEAEEEQNP